MVVGLGIRILELELDRNLDVELEALTCLFEDTSSGWKGIVLRSGHDIEGTKCCIYNPTLQLGSLFRPFG
jgi:hypothetical protein